MRSIAATLLLCAVSFAADKPRVIRWAPNQEGCTVIFANGIPRERLSDGGRVIDVWAPKLRDKHTFDVLVGVQNQSNTNLDINPENIGGLAGDNLTIILKSINADAKIAKEARSAHRWSILGAALSGAAAGYGTTGTATVNNSDGTTSTVSYHETGDTRQSRQDAAANNLAISERARSEASRLLRRNTVAPGQFALGDVYIEKAKQMSKREEMREFVIDLGDTIYIFPYFEGRVPR